MDTLIESVRHFFLKHHPECLHLDVGFSGGLDSCVLLLLAHQLRAVFSFELRAVHVHHGLHPYADQWLFFCEQFCERLSIPFYSERVSIEQKPKHSIESLARLARYEVFKRVLPQNGVLWTAHHADDQVETVLFQWIRGAGLNGFSGMKACKPFLNGKHARPLLSFRRKILLNYAKEKKLEWIEDDSNESLRFSRNFLRHRILSEIDIRFPSSIESMARGIQHVSTAEGVLEDYLWRDVESMMNADKSLSVSSLLMHSPEKQGMFMRTWMNHLGALVPETRKCEDMLKQLSSHRDRHPVIFFGECVWLKSRDRIYVLPKRVWEKFQSEPEGVLEWKCDETDQLMFENGMSIYVRENLGAGLKKEYTRFRVVRAGLCQTVRVRHRGTLKLQNLFQEWDVPVWQRKHLPLIFMGEVLVCVPRYFLDQECAVSSLEMGREVVWVCGE